MTTEAKQAGPEVPDFDAREQELDEQIAGLQERHEALTLDAMVDESQRTKLAEVNAELVKAKRDRGWVQSARAEHGRREEAAAVEKERRRKQTALRKVRSLNKDRVKAAERVDRAMADLVAAVTDYSGVAAVQADQIKQGGRSDLSYYVPPSSAELQNALAHALHGIDPNVARLFNDWTPARVGWDHQRPLGDATHQPTPQLEDEA
jgi:hypothetical protein